MAVSLAAWVDYYRASVADGARLCPTAKLLNTAPSIDRNRLVAGRVSEPVVTQLRREAAQTVRRAAPKGARSAGAAEAPLDVLVMPWVFAVRTDHGEKDRTLLQRFAPVVLRARVGAEGELKPHEEAPWIPRDRLRPVAHEQVTVGELAKADEFGSARAFAPQRWKDVVDHALGLVQAVAGCAVDELTDGDYVLSVEGVVCLAEGDTRMVNNILALSDELGARLRKQAEDGAGTALPALLRHAGCGPRERRLPLAAAAAFARSARHWAAVSARDPLAPMQRLAVQELLDTPEGGVLAIQGPPGTGKTTLLKNVVAQTWVEAAVAGRPCPIIVAASINHQAVTNVLDDFATDRGEPRWLPGVEDWWLYAASEESDGAKSGKYQLLTVAGAFAEIERGAEGWLPEAQRHYLACAAKEPGLAAGVASVQGVREALLARLRGVTGKITGLFGDWQAMLAQLGETAPTESLPVAMERRTDHLRGLLGRAEEQARQAQEKMELVASCASGWDKRLAEEPWWQVLLGWLVPAKQRRDAGRRLALQPFAAKLGEWTSVEEPAVGARLKELREAAARDCGQRAAEYQAADRAIQDWQSGVARLRAEVESLWREASETQRKSVGETPDALWRADGSGLEALADLTWRTQAFRAALHYWEADYLLELGQVAVRGHRRAESDTALWTRNLRRWAKLAPCMGSTFLSLPKFFRGQRDREPLWGAIDLLVADESGQVPPERSAAAFALARRALVVGDVYQIEPVWSVPASVDAANAAKFDLIEPARVPTGWAAPARRAVSASGGTLMELAQQASAVGQPGGEGGLLLREHRRCVPEIVAFNNVVYGGLLEPKRASVAADRRILPALGYASLPFRAKQGGGGRCNPGEARLIAAWLRQRREQMEGHYKENLGKLVAVVTPFRAQKRELRRELDAQLGNGHAVTAGTVHALQGAQRRIVIFSPVYDETHRGSCFFNGARGAAATADPRKRFQMLNVAVSRAQDTFLVFGCLDAFHPAGGETPASVLGRHLFGEHGHEISDLPWEAGREQPADAVALRGTAAHDEQLRAAIAGARRRVTVSSPLLTRQGLEARGVLPYLAEAVRRGVSVEVFADALLTRDPRILAEAAELLRAAGVVVWTSRPDRGVHAKTLAVDEQLLVEGSFNWFSAVAEGGPYHRYEASLAYRGEHVGVMIEEALASLRQRVEVQAR